MAETSERCFATIINMLLKQQKLIDHLNIQIEDLKTQVHFMPGNQGYLEAEASYNQLSEKKQNN